MSIAKDNGADIERHERPPSPRDLPEKDRQVYERVDSEVAKYASDTAVYVSPEKSDQLRRMIDRRVLVIMISTYFLQAIDKGTMSFASIMGIITDTGLKGQDYSWLTTCIYITILIVEYPQNWIITRVPIAKYLSFCIVAWGTVLATTAACNNFASLVTVRVLLGLFESACQPAFIVLSAMWYRREEQTARVTYWYMMNGAQQVVGGLLAYCFSLITTGPLKSWQWLFLGYGVVSVIYGLFVGWYMPDSPMRAKCFSEEDKRLMIERVRDNQTGLQSRKFRLDHVYEALRDPQVWGYALIALTTTLPTSGLGAFQGLIIKSFGFTVLQTQLLAMVLGFYIIIVLLGSIWIVKRTNQNLLVMLGFVIPSFIGTILLMTVTPDTLARKVGLLICYYITLSFWSAQTLALSMISRNVAGTTKKSVAVTINFIFWATGNSIGPQVFLAWDAPRYFIAFATHLGCYALLVLVIVALRFYLVRQNTKRDRLAAEGHVQADAGNVVHGFEDLTDLQNLSFRYVY
ncbi:major facilitator superfamily domain-containing protein [Lasiosphaeria miniovina]|uniref:Major facilitator superfamily domain-containing protein n=1 Tax=Lasiosphaeria miniovina TaxID=1954250 RepID=A0AA40A5S2_9PEZI|nr:major facilitator superfamily domain-containing protein [Lasiosphaeria miniovina]KAK0709853.1 major facilitator superfamily domain-containing protein [Lasiosphaeria miniovina]